MRNWTLQEAAAAMQGQLLAEQSMEFAGAAIDTRQIQRGQLFFALSGTRVDGHDYLAAAQAAGAAAAVVEREQDSTMPQIVVSNTRQALAELAVAWRQSYGGQLIALTGSNGKTSTKEMLAAIFAQQHGADAVLATQGNLNNDLGVPLTLLRLSAQHRVAVIEMGANHAGEIAQLTAWAKPDVGLLLNAGPAHLEGFGSLDGVANAKAEIFAGLKDEATAIVNRDDAYYQHWLPGIAAAKQISFGQHAESQVQLLSSSLQQTADGSTFRLRFAAVAEQPDASELVVNLPMAGEHQALNATAAAATALAAGCSIESIRLGLAQVRPVAGRLKTLQLAPNFELIDDSYNANPASMAAALSWLSTQPGKRIAILGGMAELGANAVELHAELGAKAQALGIDGLIAVGSARPAAEHFQGQLATVEDAAAASDCLLKWYAAEPNAAFHVLVKGSRSAAMDEVVTALQTAMANNAVAGSRTEEQSKKSQERLQTGLQEPAVAKRGAC